MYTSGWPNSQKRCCQRTGSPPPEGTKKWVPKLRSSMSSTSATVMIGKASSSRTWVMRLIQTNIGMRIIFMPGARRLMIVTKKFTAAASEAMPEDLQADDPEVDVEARAVLLGGQVGVGEPPHVRRGVEQEAGR